MSMIKGIVEYFSSSIEELKIVSWPNRAKTARLTFYVILISLSAAAYLGLLDYLLFRFTGLFIKR